MTFVMMESGAILLTLLAGWEMRRQRVPWQSVAIRSVLVLAVLTATIAMWRGH